MRQTSVKPLKREVLALLQLAVSVGLLGWGSALCGTGVESGGAPGTDEWGGDAGGEPGTDGWRGDPDAA